MWDTNSAQLLDIAITANAAEIHCDNERPTHRVRLVYIDGRGHEAVRPLELDTEGGCLFIAGGEMREINEIEKVEAI